MEDVGATGGSESIWGAGATGKTLPTGRTDADGRGARSTDTRGPIGSEPIKEAATVGGAATAGKDSGGGTAARALRRHREGLLCSGNRCHRRVCRRRNKTFPGQQKSNLCQGCEDRRSRCYRLLCDVVSSNNKRILSDNNHRMGHEVGQRMVVTEAWVSS